MKGVGLGLRFRVEYSLSWGPQTWNIGLGLWGGGSPQSKPPGTLTLSWHGVPCHQVLNFGWLVWAPRQPKVFVLGLICGIITELLYLGTLNSLRSFCSRPHANMFCTPCHLDLCPIQPKVFILGHLQNSNSSQARP